MNPGDPLAGSCPVPMEESEHVLLAHGSGGTLTQKLVRDIFLSVLGNPLLDPLHDGARLPRFDRPLVVTTDGFVVSPPFFPGGDIGRIAVAGTVNDLAVSGSRPRYLSLGVIIEEGFPVAALKRIVRSIHEAAQEADVAIVTGDTKVVPRGQADGIYIHTTGVGELHPGLIDGFPSPAREGDRVILSGPVGLHGATVLACQNGFEPGPGLVSDVRPVGREVGAVLDRFAAGVRTMRDPTRGGVATALHEMAVKWRRTAVLEEDRMVVPPGVLSVCELIGAEPYHLASEGTFLAVVDDAVSQGIADLLSDLGCPDARVIGRVEPWDGVPLVMRTTLGGEQIVEPLRGETLPRIC